MLDETFLLSRYFTRSSKPEKSHIQKKGFSFFFRQERQEFELVVSISKGKQINKVIIHFRDTRYVRKGK